MTDGHRLKFFFNIFLKFFFHILNFDFIRCLCSYMSVFVYSFFFCFLFFCWLFFLFFFFFIFFIDPKKFRTKKKNFRLPFFLMYVIVPFCESCQLSRETVNFITWLGWVIICACIKSIFVIFKFIQFKFHFLFTFSDETTHRYMNSAINPLIYCGFNRDFRRAFQKIILCKNV